MLLAAVVASYCAGVALILVLGSVDDGDSMRLGGNSYPVLTLALIAYGSGLERQACFGKGILISSKPPELLISCLNSSASPRQEFQALGCDGSRLIHL